VWAFGKSFIPLLSSFACAVPGIMATRVIEDRKLRIITVLVAPLMTCSARLPVYAIMIAAFIPYVVILGFLNSHGLLLGALYFLGCVWQWWSRLFLKKTFLQTQRGTFMMEMPSYKVPTLSSVLIRVFNRAKAFVLRRARPYWRSQLSSGRLATIRARKQSCRNMTA